MIYKILSRTEWAAAKAAGVFAGAAIDLQDGYIHFSTAEQVKETAAKHFAGQSDLILLSVNENTIAEDLKWEVSRGGALFPHLYNSLPVSAVCSEAELHIDEQGRHVFPELQASSQPPN